MLTPEEYLVSQGIDINAMLFVAYVDGVFKNPDILEILKGYAEVCKKEGESNDTVERED